MHLFIQRMALGVVFQHNVLKFHLKRSWINVVCQKDSRGLEYLLRPENKNHCPTLLLRGCKLFVNQSIHQFNCFCHIPTGMVKSHHNDVYWQILEYRKKMALARLGFAPDWKVQVIVESHRRYFVILSFIVDCRLKLVLLNSFFYVEKY